MRKPSRAVLLLAIALLPMQMLARDDRWPRRICVRAAADARVTADLSSLQAYNRGVEALLEERRVRYRQAWDIGDEDGRNDALKQADREYRQRERELRKARRDAEREWKRNFNDVKRRCRNLNDIDIPPPIP